MRTSDTPTPLAGLRVLDLSRVLAGPWATQLWGDLGAEVLKIEHPTRGDDTRGWGPPWVGDAGPSAYFCAANRSKASLAVDLKSASGRAVIRDLCRVADVVVQNFKPGTMERWGLGFDALQALNPRIILCSISAFGLDGPGRDRPGYDALVQAMGGLMSITGEPEGKPQKVGLAVVDLMTGMYASNAVLAALYERERTGVGRHVDLSLYEVQLAWLANQATNHLIGGRVPTRQGSAHPNIVPYQPFATVTGLLMVAVGNDRQFAAFAETLGHAEWATDVRFATNAARVEHRACLVDLIQAVLEHQPSEVWQARLERAGVPVGPVRTIAEAFADPVVTWSGGVVRQDMAAGVSVTPGVPVRVDGVRVEPGAAPPEIGEGGEEMMAAWLSGT